MALGWTTSDQWTCWRANLEKFRQTHIQLQLDDLPTLTDLEIAFRRVPKHKASGLDRVPSELCGSCPRELARQNYGALLKLVIHGQESLGHKGGTLTPAHKGKGPLTDPMAYRSLLVSSHLGKNTSQDCETDPSASPRGLYVSFPTGRKAPSACHAGPS